MIGILITVVVTLAAISGCDMLESVVSGEEHITLVLPPVPPAAVMAGITDPVWSISWVSGNSSIQKMEVHGTKAELPLEKGRFTPVLAQLATDTVPCGPFPSAGSIYPALAEASLSGSRIQANYPGGIAACTALKALQAASGGPETAGMILSRLNWQRLTEKIAALEDPCCINYERLIEAILSGSVHVYDICMYPVRAYRVTLPAGGIPAGTEFIPAWPGGTGFLWPESGSLSLELPDGMTRYYASTGYITIQAGGTAGSITFFMPYSLQE